MDRMRAISVLSWACAFLMCSSSAVQAGQNVWTTHGPEGGRVEALAISASDPQVVYAGMLGGRIYRSTDGGAHWVQVNAALPTTGVSELQVSPTDAEVVYQAVGYDGVFKSTDGGDHWLALNDGLSDTGVQALSVSRTDDQLLYAGTRTGVFRSTDGGAHWQAVNSGLANTDIWSLEVSPTDSQRVYVGTEDGVYVSADGGEHWEPANAGLAGVQIEALSVSPIDAQLVYAQAPNQVYKTTDGGEHWAEVFYHSGAYGVVASPVDAQVVYAGTWRDGVYRSTNGGGDWEEVNDGLCSLEVRVLAVSPMDDVLYAGTDGQGVYRSLDGGGHWAATNDGLTSAWVQTLLVSSIDSDVLYAGTGGAGVYRALDRGLHWTAVNSGLANAHVVVLRASPFNAHVLYAATEDGVFRSTDGGGHWTGVNSGIVDRYVQALAISPTNDQVLYAGGGELYRSTDAGDHWDRISSEPFETAGVQALAVSSTNSQVVFAGSMDGVYKTTDGGEHWEQANGGLDIEWVWTLAVSPVDPDLVYARTSDGRLYKSEDEGGSWTATNSGLGNSYVNALALDPLDSHVVYAGTSDGRVYKSGDRGESWTTVNSGLDDVWVSSLSVSPADPQMLYAGTWGGGVYSIELPGTHFSIRVEGPEADWEHVPPLDCATLTLGYAKGATDGVDAQLGERELPPTAPTPDVFDARFAVAGTEGVWRDLRAPEAEDPVWRIQLNAGLEGYPLTLSWVPAMVPSGGWWVTSDQDASLRVDMGMQDTLVITDANVTSLTIRRGVTAELTYGAGWNLVSLPVRPSDGSVDALFPDAISAFEYGNGYGQVDTLEPCEGYWLNLSTGGTYAVSGQGVDSCATDLPGHWSLVGIPLSGAEVSEIGENPADNVHSIFGFAGAYVLKGSGDLLEEGQGYWFNLASPGQVVLRSAPSGASRQVAQAPVEEAGMGKLWVRSGSGYAELRLGVAAEAVRALPPLPPAGVLDARVRVGDVDTWEVPESAEPAEYAVRIQGESVTLGWDVPLESGGQWELEVGDRTIPLRGAGEVEVGDPGQVRVTLRQVAAVPLRYALRANYPNPFNPSTTIGYALKEQGTVSLSVYDVTGQRVRELVGKEQPAGVYAVTWDGRDDAGVRVSSGVYFYELRAGDFHSVRKMVMMK